MSALVVFESMFGNTRDIAEALAAGLGTRMAVEIVEVGAAPAALGDDVDLLVVGGPTHAFGLTRPSTRADAPTKSDTPIVSKGDGLREWLDALERPAAAVPAATFDTRIRKPRVPGSAAKAAAKRLRGLGFELVGTPTSFWVEDVDGPLTDGEVDRARRWGEQLAALAAARPGQPAS